MASATRQDVPVEIRAIGNVEAFRSVAVKSQVSGILEHIYFKEGSDVRKGDPLFLIDPRPLQDQVQQAEATLARDRAAEKQAEAAAAKDTATARNARVEADRYAGLFNQGIVSHEQRDQFETAAQAAEQAAQADQASIGVAREATHVDQARLTDAQLQLSYTSIHSPIDGRTGNLTIKEGNLVKAEDTAALVVINQVAPIYVTFAVPEKSLPDIRRYAAQQRLRVEASPVGAAPAVGTLDFIDNAVDIATGTIKLKALFQNADRRLWPGEFVNVALTLTIAHGATVVPTSAVQTGQHGKYVLVVDSNLVAHEQSVTVGAVVGGSTMIQAGLAPGERVVTDGQLGVTPGGRVQISTRRTAQ